MPSHEKRTVFVTVGTTQFDHLVTTVLSDEALALLAEQGYHRLCIQYGRGTPPPAVPASAPLEVESYRFKDSLAEDMQGAALLVSHAGAGSIMEGLRCRAALVVVVNDQLMHNHQQELAHELDTRGHLVATTPAGLVAALRALPERASKLTPFPESDPDIFPAFLEAQLGLVDAKPDHEPSVAPACAIL